jgi:hypothetical protein
MLSSISLNSTLNDFQIDLEKRLAPVEVEINQDVSCTKAQTSYLTSLLYYMKRLVTEANDNSIKVRKRLL